jgi:outer membrane protein assembly factor BamB
LTARLLLFSVLGLLACGRGQLPPPPALFPVERSWLTPLPRLDPEVEERIVGSLATDGRRLFVATEAGFVHALDRATGEILWRTGDRKGLLAADADHLLLRQPDGVVLSLDPADGTARWRTETTASGDLPPVLQGRLVLLAGPGVTALDAASGRVLWTAPADGDATTTTVPVVVGPSVLAGESDGTLRSRDSATGASLWTYRTRGALRAPPVAGGRDRLFLGTTDGRILALRHAQRAKPAWRWTIGADVRTPPALFHDAVLVATLEDVLYALRRRNGHLWWRAPLPNRPLSGPIVMGSAVLVACQDDEIVAFDGRTGRRIGALKTPAEMATPPLPLDGRLYVGLRDGSVTALEPAAARPSSPPSPSPTGTPSPEPRPMPPTRSGFP